MISPRILAGLLFATILAGPLGAQDEAGDAVESGRQALRRSASYPWYDAQADDLQDVNAREKKVDDTATRKSGWEAEIQKVQPTQRATNWQWPDISQVLQIAAMVALGAALCVILWLLIRYFLREEDLARTGSEMEFEPTAGEIDRVEALPYQVRRSVGNLLSEAQRLYEAGRYGEAIVYLYSHFLVELDRHQRIRLAKGKTNRQYLRELRSHAELREIVETTMLVFEDAFFGRYEITRERFESCWRLVPALQRALEPQGALV
jgi:hypothetical protein